MSRADEWKDLAFFATIFVGLIVILGGVVKVICSSVPDSPCYESATPMAPGTKGAYCNEKATLEIVENVAICRCPKEKK